MPRDPESQRRSKKKWYDNNRQVYYDRNKRRTDEKREIIRAAKDRPCMDCLGSYPTWVMDFDHREGEVKLGNIGTSAYQWGKKKLFDEIAKCDVVCANCHRIRTHERWIASSMNDPAFES